MLLAVDSSTQMVGLALYDGAQVLGEMTWQTRNHHTVELAPAVENLMERCAIRMNQLEALGVALGPGSFTSLRIGLALVKGLSLALKLPVVGVPTLDFLAAAQPLRAGPMAALLQAGRKRLALGWYAVEGGRWKAQGAPVITTIEELAERIETPTWVCGEMSAAERQVIARKRKLGLLASPAQCTRRPANLAELAWNRWQAGESDDPVSLAPIYLLSAGE